MFFNGGYLSEHGYSQVSELLWIGGKNDTTPFNMKQLIALELDQEIVNFSDYDSTYICWWWINCISQDEFSICEHE